MSTAGSSGAPRFPARFDHIFFYTMLLLANTTPTYSADLSIDDKWRSVQQVMRSLRRDGTLRMQIPLSKRSGQDYLSILGISPSAQHEISVDARGLPRSSWNILCITTWLSEVNGQSRWMKLSGEMIDLSEKTARKDGVLIRLEHIQEDGQLVSVVHSDGIEWYYANGILYRIRMQDGENLIVTCNGAKISSVRNYEKTIISADYHSNGLPYNIAIGRSSWQLAWGADRHLENLALDRRIIYSFTYHDGLLVYAKLPSGDTRTYSWRQNEGYERGDSRWFYPVQLSSDGVTSYRTMMKPNFWQHEIQVPGKSLTTIRFLGFENRVIVSDSEGTEVFQFSGRQGSWQQLEWYEDKSGKRFYRVR